MWFISSGIDRRVAETSAQATGWYIEVMLWGHNGQCKGFVHSQVNLKQRSGWEVGAQVKRGNNKPLFFKTS